MGTLEKLIAQLCPDGVEYKPLGELVADGCLTMTRGMVISRKDIADCPGDFPVYSSSAIGNGEFGRYGKFMFNEELVTWSIDGGGKFFYRPKAKFSVTNVCGYIRINDLRLIVPKFLFYTLSTQWTHKEYDYTHKALPSNIVKDYLIPLPPLPVQKEIVRMLDDMAGLIDALEEELAARKKQYEWCRERMLTFGDDVERKALEEISTDFFRGSGILRAQVTTVGTPCVRYGEIYTSYDIWFDECLSHTRLEYITSPKFFEYGDILFAITGEKIEEIGKAIAYIGKDRCIAGGDTVVMKHKQNAKFIAYVLSTTDVQNQKSRGKVKSKVVHLSVPQLKAIKIPIPALSVQERIVRKLDDMTALIAALEEELAARKQQYEYYRNKLLTFKRKPEVA